MLLAVLNDILDLSKVEAGRLQLELEPLEPALLVEEVQKLFSETALRAGVGLASRVELPPHAAFLGDPTRLRQMLCNLVSNALKFTAVGRVELGLRALGGELEFAVTDTGPGIPLERQAALFQPFSQVHDGAHLGGTGLGLSIVRRLAEAMGGSAGLESTVGQGARVWFRVPLSPVASRRPSSPSILAVPHALPSGLRVMAAEDNATNRKVISALLAKLGVAVETVDNGLAAVARLVGEPSERPHLVLMDCQMPELDGLEATARVRRWEAQRGAARLPIVALTASAYEEDRQKALAAGMDDFLAKPVSLEALRQVLARWARPG
jgi:CheY-like chemotaxis protein